MSLAKSHELNLGWLLTGILWVFFRSKLQMLPHLWFLLLIFPTAIATSCSPLRKNWERGSGTVCFSSTITKSFLNFCLHLEFWYTSMDMCMDFGVFPRRRFVSRKEHLRSCDTSAWWPRILQASQKGRTGGNSLTTVGFRRSEASGCVCNLHTCAVQDAEGAHSFRGTDRSSWWDFEDFCYPTLSSQ